jgi:chemotaxis protein methyltransferase CheR
LLNAALSDEWARMTALIAECLGLHFPPERRNDLERGIREAAPELGYEDAAACVAGLLAAPPGNAQIRVLASHLTIGETYFFRDRPVMEALAETVLPELIRARRGGEQRLRIWSAACCSGEEAYSVAILLHRLLPDLRDWQVTITATDINPRFLQKAAAGTYGEWSFRGAPAWLKQQYFERTGDGRYTIVPEIRKMASFTCLNLAKDAYPSLATDTNAMDVVLCRNVLMYFTPALMREVTGKLHHALVDGGWLAASPSESSAELFAQFTGVNFPGAILFRKDGAVRPAALPPPAWTPRPEPFVPAAMDFPSPMPSVAQAFESAVETEAPVTAQPSLAAAQSLYREGRYAEAADTLRVSAADHPRDGAFFSLLVHALANQGRLADALAWCERWIAADKVNCSGHYLRAVVLLEQGDRVEARMSLQRAIYLDPEFVLAHYALGNLARSSGKPDEADRHFANALLLLHGRPPDEPLPESDGLTARRLAEFIASLTATQGRHDS